MFKRVLWMGTGFGAGVGATVWANVKLRRTAQRFTPAALTDEVAGRARALRADVRDAVSDGRQAMAKREAELRAGHRRPGSTPTPDPSRSIPAESRRRVPVGPASAALDHGVTGAAQLGPAVPWSDHGHEWASARLS